MKTRATSRVASRAGITRPELLACIAVLSLIAVLQITALARGNQGSIAELCRNNHRQLIQAWLLYSDDHRDELPPNDVGSAIHGSWAAGWLDFEPNPDNTNVLNLVGFRCYLPVGHLGPYLKSAAVFRCPSDESSVTISGQHYNRVRSVSMNPWMGERDTWQETVFQSYASISQIGTPGNRFVITDQNPYSINDGALQLSMTDTYLDYPGIYHSGGTWMSFADGHVAFHRWTDPRTFLPAPPPDYSYFGAVTPDNADLDWLYAHATERRR